MFLTRSAATYIVQHTMNNLFSPKGLFGIKIKLGYQKGNNAAAHSVDIYIFYAVIHLHIHP